MQLKLILFMALVLLIPISLIAEETVVDKKTIEIESMNIQALIEEAKMASSDDRVKIESIIKKKIARAHRDKSIKG